ncbi:MAG TPA: hypothetical protein PLH23_18765 [Hyphomonadaceae bacterium]|nr:hypothetical protein [Hyphomonadaceae bacterium]HPI50322.1 hypothetical protein [Hyphomonadaceae bacterium]HPN07240.1 hypothetical protein [Hyphomonadaceae bacterium]
MSSAASRALSAFDLAQFTGSETFYRHPLSGGCVYTEGVQYLAEAGSAYWLIDAILCPQPHVGKLQAAEFQVWTLTVRADHSATLICTDGDDGELYSHPIPWTDFPLASVSLWFSNRTLYLPSEH